jgi:hypothetical protein
MQRHSGGRSWSFEIGAGVIGLGLLLALGVLLASAALPRHRANDALVASTNDLYLAKPEQQKGPSTTAENKSEESKASDKPLQHEGQPQSPEPEQVPAPVLARSEAPAAPAKAKPAAISSDRQSVPAVRRLDPADAEDLRKDLLLAPEVGLDAVPNTSNRLVAFAANSRVTGRAYLGPIMLTQERLDLASLPLQTGMDCVLGKEPAEDLQAMSRKLRRAIESCIPQGGDPRPDPEKLRKLVLDDKGGWLKPEAVPCLQQMLQAENHDTRKVLIDALRKIPDRRATEALAMRALVDLSPEVRSAAIQALKDRASEEYRPLLNAGLRYPWNPVVAHAAEALIALEGNQAGGELTRTLLEPDPSWPFTVQVGRKEVPVVREVVRVNHLANCVLCHAPSFDSSDLVRAAIPVPGQPLPGPATAPAYYEGGENFVRADVTYLRQHFSVVQPVLRSGQWPANQRFDYLVRLRPLLTKKESDLARALLLKPLTPQKELLVQALKDLTGRDPGTTAEEWQKFAAADREESPIDDKTRKHLEKEWGQFLPPKAWLGIEREKQTR